MDRENARREAQRYEKELNALLEAPIPCAGAGGAPFRLRFTIGWFIIQGYSKCAANVHEWYIA